MRTAVSLVICLYSDDVISRDEACPRFSKFGESANEKDKRVYRRINPLSRSLT